MLLCFISFQTVSEVKARLLEALADDFDTPKAMSAIVELVGVTNKMLHQKSQHVGIFYISSSSLYIHNTKDTQ
jgi:cysteinyl-tRNA synthetase